MAKTFRFTKKDFIRTVAALSSYVDTLDDRKSYTFEVKEERKKRSLNANAYCWLLLEKLSEKLGIPKEEIYRQYIKDSGVCRQCEISEEAASTLMHSWALHGTGWVSEQLDRSPHKGYVLINLYYGSSVYNTQQMSRLIDNIVQDCKDQGIETATPEELERMKGEWNA